MTDRLTPLDATFLELEQNDQAAHMHIGGALVFDLRVAEKDCAGRKLADPGYVRRGLRTGNGCAARDDLEVAVRLPGRPQAPNPISCKKANDNVSVNVPGKGPLAVPSRCRSSWLA